LRRIGIFGWGIVAPRSANIAEFARNLETAESWLVPFEGFGPDNFLVGMPKFQFEDYRSWIEQRFPANRFRQLVEKMDLTTQYAIGAFIQSLQQNPGLEQELSTLGSEAHVYVGTGLSSIPTTYSISVTLYRAQRRWNRFWASPERNAAHAAYLKDGSAPADPPPDNPETILDVEQRELAEDAWYEYWTRHSDKLAEYLQELEQVESLQIEGDVETGKLRLLREKGRRLAKLSEKWSAPEPPWARVSPNLLWNISNSPASQISMLGRITGLAFAPVAACSTFGVALKLAMDAIDRGEAKFVVVGATDPPPHPLSVGAFYNGRVLSAGKSVSKPLSTLRGTHVAGGSAIWIVGDLEYAKSRGYTPIGLEPVAVGTSSDADHIITPSVEGPRRAVRQALERAACRAEEIGSWDLHATATPGDYQEIDNLRHLLPQTVLVTARKGTFGHGMSVAGGWELTAQYLGCQERRLHPTTLSETELNEQIRELHQRFVFNRAAELPRSVVGKLSMGVGGVNACVISRLWQKSSA
jgi:3-oxoacyl-(acyl-carrier-protein) synthase